MPVSNRCGAFARLSSPAAFDRRRHDFFCQDSAMISFARNFISPSGSPIRELFPYLNRPGMISFAGGYPSPELFDAEGLGQAAAQALQDRVSSLQYGATEGSPALRGGIAELLATRGIRSSAAEILVTTGSQQAFDLLIRVLIEPGDSVLIETPAYPAAIQALRLAGANLLSVPTDEQGLDVAALEARLRENPQEAPKLLYLVPSFSNPSGSLLSLARRRKLVELARRHGFLIVEDDPYGELRFSDDALPTLYEIARQTQEEDAPVVYLSSLSKTVSPGLRIGWMVASPELYRRCAIAKQTADLCTSTLAQSVAVAYLQSGRYAAGVARASQEYHARMSALVDALRGRLGTRLRLTPPQGGMFLWVENVAHVDAEALFHAGVRRGVLYVPGKAFYPDARPTGAMRLSFAAPKIPDIIEGVNRLAQAYEEVAGG
ncbi:aminotransferase-like domain-containing protein [Brenneria tiliae]|uniref:aminotransferase-like domain-containing protein n=1 Tax=Brenneria tiliae TaxID=2914984 RepID=UPI002014FA6F|nr:PLP-dependent aminotransferase family protein [Brenneria tiliae]MCL2899112.1 PLP-dependent aminotransferase family protein [Brenneria tiliae]MCL2903490.1 PLP-dependent aminotransferase family protein [Brenneria tiliae]